MRTNKRAKTFIVFLLIASCPALCWSADAKQEDNKSTKAEAESVTEDFNVTVDSMMPLSPVEIRQLREIVEGKQEAISEIKAPKTTTLKSVPVSLEPGAATPTINLLPNHAIAIEIVDGSGQPWPITSHIVGDKDRFHVEVPEVGSLNIITISPQTTFGRTNLLLTLANESTPISITLKADIDIEHYHDRLTLLVQGKGPNASLPVFMQQTAVEDPLLLGVLDGIKPANSNNLKASTSLIKGAWRLDQTMWIRGDFVLVSPAPQAQVSGSGGIMAYQLNYTPVILAYTRDGKTLQIQLSEKPNE